MDTSMLPKFNSLFSCLSYFSPFFPIPLHFYFPWFFFFSFLSPSCICASELCGWGVLVIRLIVRVSKSYLYPSLSLPNQWRETTVRHTVYSTQTHRYKHLTFTNHTCKCGQGWALGLQNLACAHTHAHRLISSCENSCETSANHKLTVGADWGEEIKNTKETAKRMER